MATVNPADVLAFCFNCCTDETLNPSDYDAWEVHPVKSIAMADGSEACEVVSNPDDATFWSVYGHLPEGGVEALHDDDRETCVALATALEAATGKPWTY